LGLVLAFSVGLATALTIVGMGAMRVRDLAVGRLSATAARLIPLASAAAIVVVGLYVIARSMSAV
jgi:ABC-type nickel/cobalt efflux system permease component RcnA